MSALSFEANYLLTIYYNSWIILHNLILQNCTINFFFLIQTEANESRLHMLSPYEEKNTVRLHHLYIWVYLSPFHSLSIERQQQAMAKISHLIYFFVFLILVATNCMARIMANQAIVGSNLHHLINTRQIIDGCRPCRCDGPDSNCCPCPDCCSK